MINLFEYQNKVNFPSSLEHLDEFLDDIWNRRERSYYYDNEETDRVEVQQFIQILHRHQQLKSNNYVGSIHYGDQTVNLLPKIFYQSGRGYTDREVKVIQQHILWWLSYCRKIKFPNYQTSLGSMQSNFFEILIYLFAKYTRELLNSQIYRQYQEINRELPYIKGRLNTAAYINENISRGRWHRLNCTFDAFIVDNAFNRIIKYVATLLLSSSQEQENKKYLREILFILDEVSDESATARDCMAIQFNPMMASFETVRDYCQLFLSNSISFHYKNELQLFAFLLPMEYVFEDFIFGFIQRELSGITARSQVRNTWLDTDKNFQLRPDIFLQLKDGHCIADTKYKIVYADESKPKSGIAQSDLYQMVAYAIRFKVDTIYLFYPDTITTDQVNDYQIQIEDQFAEGQEIKVRAIQLPIIHRALWNDEVDEEEKLGRVFEPVRQKLVERFTKVLG